MSENKPLISINTEGKITFHGDVAFFRDVCFEKTVEMGDVRTPIIQYVKAKRRRVKAKKKLKVRHGR